jgi:hypothetical protein
VMGEDTLLTRGYPGGYSPSFLEYQLLIQQVKSIGKKININLFIKQ